MELFNRDGKEFTGTPEINEKGKPYTQVAITCDRCHVIGGRRLWIMGIENNRPYSKTGFDCWTCGNTGVRKMVDDRLYTAEELAKINATAQKRAAKRFAAEQAEAARKAAEQAVKEAAFLTSCSDFIATLSKLDGEFWDSFTESFLRRATAPTERQAAMVEAEVAKRAQNAASAFVGAVGDKIVLTITIERLIPLESQFGTTYINLCRDQQGNVIVYKGNSNIGDVGETVNVRATVKEHVLYNAASQTVIQRPKLV